MNIFWEKDHDTTLDVWLRQFRIEEVCMPNYTYVGGDITFRIGARFILHDGIDYWIGESATNRYGGYAYALLRVVDMPKLVNGGYRYWEFKTESWRETGYFYRFTVSSRQMDSKYPERIGQDILINGRINGSDYYKIKTDPIIRSYLPAVSGKTREEETLKIMHIINGVESNRKYINDVLEDPIGVKTTTGKAILRECKLKNITTL